MAFPSGVELCTLTFGSALTMLGEGAEMDVTVKPSHSLAWAATGQAMIAHARTVKAGADAPSSISVPVVDQPGFIDSSGNAFTMWAYSVSITYRVNGTATGTIVTKAFQPLSGQATVDLDVLPDSTITLPVSAPYPEVLSVNGQTGHVTVSGGGEGGGPVTWASVTGKPATFAPIIGSGATQAVAGNDSRLTDSRTPTTHTHPVAQISATGTPSATTYLRGDGAWSTPAGGGGSTAWADVTGKPAVIGAGADQAAARTAIGAGTSSLALGSTGSTAAAGDHTHTPAAIGAAATSHTHTASQVTDLTAAVEALLPEVSPGYLVLDADEDVPDGTPAGTAIFRIGEPAGPEPEPPATPTGLASSAITDTGFRFSWSAASGATSYQWRQNSGSPTSTSALFVDRTGLAAETAYTMEVRAVNADGPSSWASLVITTDEATGDAPTALLAVGFDEGTGTTFTPEVGPGTGALNPSVGSWVTGRSGSGFAISRTTPTGGSPSTLSGLSSLNTPSWSGLTVAAWVLPQASGVNRFPLVILNGTTDWVGWDLAPGGGVETWVESTNIAGGTVTNGVWAHLAVTWDGTTVRSYVNGTLVGSSARTGALPAITSATITSAPWSDTGAAVDDFHMFNVALTADQLTALMAVSA